MGENEGYSPTSWNQVGCGGDQGVEPLQNGSGKFGSSEKDLQMKEGISSEHVEHFFLEQQRANQEGEKSKPINKERFTLTPIYKQKIGF